MDEQDTVFMLTLRMLLMLASAQTPGTFTLEAKHAPLEWELGTLFVKENREAAKSRVIRISFARIKGPKDSKAPPIFFLPGGPGASMLGTFSASDANAQRRLAMFRRYASVSDVIVFDQRGFSLDRLQEPDVGAVPLDRPHTLDAEIERWRRFAKALPAANPGADLAGYSIKQCVEDVDELRKALRYERISLVAGSFGSQESLAVIRLKPQIVARAVLSSVEPLDAALDHPSQLYAALQRIAFDADHDSRLAPWLPPGGVLAAAQTVRERLLRAPVSVTVDGATIVLGAEDWQTAMLPDDAAEWPALVLDVFHGHFEGWAKLVLEERRRTSPFFAAINPLIDSTLTASADRRASLRTDPALALLGGWGTEPHLQTKWPPPDVGDELRRRVVSQTPVLFVHGDWDTSTPIDNALGLLPYFPRGRLIISHRGEHGQATYLAREAGDALLAFLRDGSLDAVPTEVTLPLPVFSLPQRLDHG